MLVIVLILAIISLSEGLLLKNLHRSHVQQIMRPYTNMRELKLHATIPNDEVDKAVNIETDPLALPEAIQELNKNIVETVKSILKYVYGERHYARFAALETIARVPYFSYTSVLHLYETLGWFRKKEYIEIHFAESWNELHHLLIMEALGGNDKFIDRFVAQHIAFFYYWIVVALYMFAPAVAYDLNKHVECHAFDTYDQFLNENKESLQQQPAPNVAIDYYEKGDLYMFDAFQYHLQFKKLQPPATDASEMLPYVEDGYHERLNGPRRPKVKTLYDVFVNIRADEAEHAETMQILQRDMCLRSRGMI